MKKTSKIIALIFLTLMSFSGVAKSEEKTSNVGYFIGIKESEFQRKTGKTYFDLRVKPDTKTTLNLIITNTSDKDAKFHLAFYRVGTNSNQVVTYDKDTENKEKAPVDINELVTLPKTQVEVKAKSDITVPLELDMKGKTFDGLIAGGITVTKVLEEKKSGYNNVYSYLKAIALTENDTKIEPDLKLNEIKGVANFGYNQIAVNLSNTKAVAFDLEKTEGVITSESDQSTVTLKKGEGQVAPNSSFDVLFDYKDVVPKGWYTLDMWVYAKGGKKWHFTDRFEIKEVKENYVEQMVQQGMMKKENGFPWWLWLVIGVLTFSFVFLLVVIFLRRKRQKEEEEKNEILEKIAKIQEQNRGKRKEKREY